MAFPRITAAIFVLGLIGTLSLGCIGMIAIIGPTLAHGNNVEYAEGKIISIGPGMDFVLETETGQVLHFQCGNQWRASLGHMLRHLLEHAQTDVYYIEGPHNILLALDID